MNSPLLIAFLLLSFLCNNTVEKADVVDSTCDGHFNGTNRGNDLIAVNTHLTSVSSVLNVIFRPHRLCVLKTTKKELQYTRLLSGLVGRRIVRLETLFSRSEVDKGSLFRSLPADHHLCFRRLRRKLYSANHRLYYAETSRREKRKLRFSFIRSPERDGEVFGEQFPNEFLPGICEFALK